MTSFGSINASYTNMTDIIINQKPHQSHNQMIEDPRTLQLALELSLVGLNDNQQPQNNNGSYIQTHPMSTQSDYEMGSSHNTIVTAVYGRADMSISNLPTLPALPSTTTASGLLMPSSNLEDRTKKSQNMTECVPVPSSEHVAEIVGRQGCKIKALRAKTNTYIKTPVRGEEPVFVVTGRKEDVNKAKREILSAADHFSLIRASRKPSVDGSNAMFSGTSINPATLGGIVARTQSGPPCLPGQITIQVRVPYRVVGLVVGPKGATIKHIQQETQTYIVTPSREKEPIFEVTGLPDNVETARKQIEAHIALRTGNSGQSSENGTESIASTKSTNNSVNTPPELVNIWKNLNDSIDIDEGIGDSPSIWNLPSTTTAVNITTHITASNCSPTASISPTDSLLGEHKDVPKIMNKLHNPEEIQPLNQLQQLQLRTTTTADKLHAMHRECCVCNEREVTTALVPCGHNMFCMDCANQICVSLESLCPICHSIVYHAMRIIA